MRLYVRTHVERAARLAAQSLLQHPSRETELIVADAVAQVTAEGEPVYAEWDIRRAVEEGLLQDPIDLPNFVVQYLRAHAQ